MSEQLLPCPFCSGEAELKTSYDTEYVVCKECGAMTNTFCGDYYDEGLMNGFYAIAAWNRRAEPGIGIPITENKPLTLEELRGMEGEPVWVGSVEKWCLVHLVSQGPFQTVHYFTASGFFATALFCEEKFYRQKPKGGEGE